jgi:hypothetical protein
VYINSYVENEFEAGTTMHLAITGITPISCRARMSAFDAANRHLQQRYETLQDRGRLISVPTQEHHVVSVRIDLDSRDRISF